MATVTYKVVSYNDSERRVYVDFDVNGVVRHDIYDLVNIPFFDKPMGLPIFLRTIAQSLASQSDKADHARAAPTDSVAAMVGRTETMTTGAPSDKAHVAKRMWMLPGQGIAVVTPRIQTDVETFLTGGALVLASGEFDYRSGALQVTRKKAGDVIARSLLLNETEMFTSVGGGQFVVTCPTDPSARYTYSTETLSGRSTPTAGWMVVCDGSARVNGVEPADCEVVKLDPGVAVEGFGALVCYITQAETPDVRALRAQIMQDDVKRF